VTPASVPAGGPANSESSRIAALEAKIEALEQFLTVQDETVIVQSDRLEALSEDRRQLLNAATHVAERERVRVAEELHDGAIQHLVALGYQIERAVLQLERGEVEKVRESLAGVRTHLNAQLKSLRALMTRLRPPSLDVTGVSAAIEDFAGAYTERTGIQTAMTIDSEERLTSELEALIYRVTLESLSNVAEHSEADLVRIDISREQAGWVQLTISDDGVGFDVDGLDRLVRDGKFGLAGMRESVEAAGGSFLITSEPGGGTRMTVHLPDAGETEDVDASTSSLALEDGPRGPRSVRERG
jgi:signal transduction histidine kinase